MTTTTTTNTDTTNTEDTAMTTPAFSLAIGDCYVLANTNHGTVWCLDGDNGRGWLLFSLVDGEDPKSTRRVRASAILAPISCSGPIPEPTGAPTLAIRGSGAILVAGPSSGAPESQAVSETATELSAAPLAPAPLDALGGVTPPPTRRESAKQERAARLAIAKQERAAARQLATEERTLARIVAADAKAAEKAAAKAARELARDEDDEDRIRNPMAKTLSRYSCHYVPAKNASGTNTKTNGDELATAWLAMEVDEFCQYAAGLLGVSPHLYSHLNPGQQRMNLGNRLRGAIRKGTMTTGYCLAAIARVVDPT